MLPSSFGLAIEAVNERQTAAIRALQLVRVVFACLMTGILAAIACGAGASTGHAEGCSEITVGSVISFTGGFSTGGKLTRSGYELAVSQIRQSGGIKVASKCYNFRVIYQDDESDPRRAASLAERLIRQDKAQILLGPYATTLTAGMIPHIEKHNVPMLLASGAVASLFEERHVNLFSVAPTSDQYVSETLALAFANLRAQGRNPTSLRLALAIENDRFSEELRRGLLGELAEHGVRPVLDERFPANIENMGGILAKAARLDLDLLIVSGHAKVARASVKRLDAMKIKTPMVAVTHCEAAGLSLLDQHVTEGILCPSQWSEDLPLQGEFIGTSAQFAAAYRKQFPGYAERPVPYQAAAAAAAIYVLADAVKRAASPVREKIRDALAATDLETFYGPVRFAADGRNQAASLILRQLQRGEYRTVAPTRFATHPLIWPRFAPLGP